MNQTFRRSVVALGCTALLVPGLGACLRSGGHEPAGPPHPKQWDSRVVPYVELAEELRGLTFKHPVTVEFQAPKEFEKGLAADESELDDEDRKELEQFTGMLRALGLVHGDVDLFDEQDKLMTGGTLAYYSFDDETVRVRGTRITPAVKSTLVHELVHVLQDQRFDAGDRKRKLAKADDSTAMAYSALVEGDARRIETKYAEQLSRKERRALRRDEARQSRGASDAISGVPEVLQTMMGAPYSLGEALLDVAMINGEDEVDDLFRNPPTTEEHLVDPFTLTADDDSATEVARPALEDGQKKFDSNTFESTGWLLTLAARLPLSTALVATDGWGGDRYVAYTEGGRTCVKIQYVGDTSRDADELHAALRTWIGKGPAGTATVQRDGTKGLLFRSCDPGTKAPSSGEHSNEAMELALSRTYLAVSLVDDGWRRADARCYATALVTHFTLDEITAETADPSTVAESRRLAGTCVD